MHSQQPIPFPYRRFRKIGMLYVGLALLGATGTFLIELFHQLPKQQALFAALILVAIGWTVYSVRNDLSHLMPYFRFHLMPYYIQAELFEWKNRAAKRRDIAFTLADLRGLRNRMASQFGEELFGNFRQHTIVIVGTNENYVGIQVLERALRDIGFEVFVETPSVIHRMAFRPSHSTIYFVTNGLLWRFHDVPGVIPLELIVLRKRLAWETFTGILAELPDGSKGIFHHYIIRAASHIKVPPEMSESETRNYRDVQEP